MTKNHKINEELSGIVLHEAGHCVMSCLLKIPFDYVTIREEDLDDGIVGQMFRQPDWRDFLEDKKEKSKYVSKIVMIYLAGAVAENNYDFELLFDKLDWKNSLKMLKSILKSLNKRWAYLSYLYGCVKWIMEHPLHRAYVRNVATEIYEQKRLTCRQVRLIMKNTRSKLYGKLGVDFHNDKTPFGELL